MRNYDAVIIGGGVLGCFAARNLMRWNISAVLVEARRDVCTGITRANTAIVYAGYDNKVGSLKAELPGDLTGSFSVVLNTRCGDFRDTKEYLMLMADLDIPLVLSEEDKKMLEAMKKRLASFPFDAKRASTASVISYVDRWWQKTGG